MNNFVNLQWEYFTSKDVEQASQREVDEHRHHPASPLSSWAFSNLPFLCSTFNPNFTSNFTDFAFQIIQFKTFNFILYYVPTTFIAKLLKPSSIHCIGWVALSSLVRSVGCRPPLVTSPYFLLGYDPGNVSFSSYDYHHILHDDYMIIIISCRNDPTYGIYSKRRGLKGIKCDILVNYSCHMMIIISSHHHEP